jgi:type IV pilus assembly protein PilP
VIPRSVSRVILVLLVGLGLGGCAREHLADLKQWVAHTNQRPGGKIESLPPVEPFPSYVYQVEELRDPFLPLLDEKEKQQQEVEIGGGVQPPPDHVAEALEAFPLDSLRMVGTLEQEGQIWSIISASDGTIHRVREGNYLGQNFGRIIAITEERVELREIVPDPRGGYMEREQKIALSK